MGTVVPKIERPNNMNRWKQLLNLEDIERTKLEDLIAAYQEQNRLDRIKQSQEILKHRQQEIKRQYRRIKFSPLGSMLPNKYLYYEKQT